MFGRPKSYHKHIMGNCIGTDITIGRKKLPLKSLNGVEEFEVSQTGGKVISRSSEVVNFSSPVKALARDVRLKSGDVYSLLPDQVEHRHHGLPSSQRAARDTYRGRRVKLVLSKQQLEHLVRNMKKIPCSGVAVIQSLRIRKRYQKWRPSLATIPEL